jgi:hypothetical protein
MTCQVGSLGPRMEVRYYFVCTILAVLMFLKQTARAMGMESPDNRQMADDSYRALSRW